MKTYRDHDHYDQWTDELATAPVEEREGDWRPSRRPLPPPDLDELRALEIADAYGHGYEIGLDGGVREANPYFAADPDRAQAWDEGWLEGINAGLAEEADDG